MHKINTKPLLTTGAFLGNILSSTARNADRTQEAQQALSETTDSSDAIVRSCYIAMEMVAWFVIIPFCFAALLTGLVRQSEHIGDYSRTGGFS
jgi:hypothetical protein